LWVLPLLAMAWPAGIGSYESSSSEREKPTVRTALTVMATRYPDVSEDARADRYRPLNMAFSWVTVCTC
jgi:hypothetical protein